jgi:hypothetical protein
VDDEKKRMFQWPIKGQLARGRRPGIEGKRGSQVPKSAVDPWIKEAKAQGIRSIICLLDERQLRFYEKQGGPVFGGYVRDYVEQFTFLLFLKMADEQARR